MRNAMSVRRLFGGRPFDGPQAWKTPVGDHAPGIYVVSLVADPDAAGPAIDTSGLPPGRAAFWNPREPVLYIGRARESVRKRMSQFYRHTHGKKSPHRGGQDVLLLLPAHQLFVFWAHCVDPSPLNTP